EPPAPAATPRTPRPRKPAPPTGAPEPAVDEAARGNSYAQYVELISAATDAETAGLTLDEARSMLDPEQLDDLAAVYRRKWVDEA
ncbi:MAG TPA: hypothetical protein VJO99_07040, partial [Burkholderiaceae bacterium]|nr:hypothetical protein [Burkholderiaceae bacterium]